MYGAATSFKSLLGKELAILTSAGMMDQLFDRYLGEYASSEAEWTLPTDALQSVFQSECRLLSWLSERTSRRTSIASRSVSFTGRATRTAWTLTISRPFSQSEPDKDKLPVMLSLLDRIGQWISSWQAPVSDMWQSVKSSRFE